MSRSEEQRNEVLRLLRADDGMRPAFQPIIDLTTGEVAGYEALARFPFDPDGREVDRGDVPAQRGQPQRVPALPRGEVHRVAGRQVGQQFGDQPVGLRRPLPVLRVPLVPVLRPHGLESVAPA